jgi:hypothetical protein
MNTIITRNYPASKLPEDLREGINPSSLVTVTIIQRKTSPAQPSSGPDEIATKEVDIDVRDGLDGRDE